MPKPCCWTEPLPANKTYGCRHALLIRIPSAQRVVGVLEIAEAKREGLKPTFSRYAVSQTSRDGDRRIFRLTKSDKVTVYWVSLVPGGSEPGAAPADLCDCDGFAGHDTCKHTQALAAHLAAGHLS
jgi:hypothetical protein